MRRVIKLVAAEPRIEAERRLWLRQLRNLKNTPHRAAEAATLARRLDAIGAGNLEVASKLPGHQPDHMPARDADGKTCTGGES